MTATKNDWKGLASRAGWAALAATAAIVTAPEVATMLDSEAKARVPGLAVAIAPLVAALFSSIKSALAMRVGTPGTVTFDRLPESNAVPQVVHGSAEPIEAELAEFDGFPTADEIAEAVVAKLGVDDPLPTVEGEIPGWADIDPPAPVG